MWFDENFIFGDYDADSLFDVDKIEDVVSEFFGTDNKHYVVSLDSDFVERADSAETNGELVAVVDPFTGEKVPLITENVYYAENNPLTDEEITLVSNEGFNAYAVEENNDSVNNESTVYKDLDGDGQNDYKIELLDVDEDGVIDAVHRAFDTDGDGQYDLSITQADTTGDGQLDLTIIDKGDRSSVFSNSIDGDEILKTDFPETAVNGEQAEPEVHKLDIAEVNTEPAVGTEDAEQEVAVGTEDAVNTTEEGKPAVSEDVENIVYEDTTGDGKIDYKKEILDSNKDGVADTVIEYLDKTGDGNFDIALIHADTTGDGVVDTNIVMADTTGDGKIDYEKDILDSNKDGVADTVKEYLDKTGDGNFDTEIEYLDRTGDGNYDIVLTKADTTGDGVLDTSKAVIDTTGDGEFDLMLTQFDTNGDGVPDLAYASDGEEVEDMSSMLSQQVVFAENIETFNPENAIEGAVVGNPENALELWEEQGDTNRCALYAQKFIIEEKTGQKIDIEEFAEVAINNGWFSEEGGTTTIDMNKMLSYYGIPNEINTDGTMEDVVNVLQDGGRVIVAIDSDEIWYGEKDGIFSPIDGSNHAVEIIGLDFSNPENPMVILNDSGNDKSGKGSMIPYEVFMEAWADSGYYMITVA